MSEVAADYGVAWWTVHRILVATAVEALGQAAPTSMTGIDETRARSVRWFFKETSWARSDPWMTSIVDLDPAHPGGIIGLAPGRSGACVEAWMALQSKEFRDGVTVVAIDPSAPYASGIRRALRQARIVLDHFHLAMLANKMLTDVRQRVQHEQQGRRGMRVDPAWAHRRLLLRAGNELGPKTLARLKTVFETDDPTNEISAAWDIKELTVRVRFPSPAPHAKSVAIHTNWAPITPGSPPVGIRNQHSCHYRAISHSVRVVFAGLLCDRH
jgi:transposase